jgi:hypothetical protein
MASNVDQDQCSPTFQQRAFILNRYEQQQQQPIIKSTKVNINTQSHYPKLAPNHNQQEMLINKSSSTSSTPNLIKKTNDILNGQNSLEEEEDQVSAV